MRSVAVRTLRRAVVSTAARPVATPPFAAVGAVPRVASARRTAAAAAAAGANPDIAVAYSVFRKQVSHVFI